MDMKYISIEFFVLTLADFTKAQTRLEIIPAVVKTKRFKSSTHICPYGPYWYNHTMTC